MNSSLTLLSLSLGLLLAAHATAAPASSDTQLTGVTMNVAKRLDTRSQPAGLTEKQGLSGVPMELAKRHNGAPSANADSPTVPTLSGKPMALAKRL